MKNLKLCLIFLLLLTQSSYAQNQTKVEKRFIDPKSIFFEVGTGLFYGVNTAKHPQFINKAFPSWTTYGKAEVGLKKNVFLEFLVGSEYYWEVIYHQNKNGSGSNAFISANFSAGIGYRIIFPKTNYNLFNVHLGASLSYQNTLGPQTSSGGSTTSANSYWEYGSIGSGINKFFPTIYIGIKKDFRLTQNLYMSLGYKYDQGFIAAYETNGEFRIDPTADFDDFSYEINGTAHSYTLGLKYKFTPKKLKK